MAFYRSFRAYTQTYNNTKTAAVGPEQYTKGQVRRDPNIKNRISALLPKANSQWEKDFLSSIDSFFDHRKELSFAQYSTFCGIESKYTEEYVSKQKEFADSYTGEKKQDIKIVASIYRAHKNIYHQELVNKVLDDETYIPSQYQYEKLMNNKYAIGFLRNVKSKPKYNIGDVVVPSSRDKTDTWKTAIIIDNADMKPFTHAEGGKVYSILPFGQTKPLLVEERDMKKHK